MHLELSAQSIPVDSAEILERKTPRSEFLLFPFGSIPTAYGELLFDTDSGRELLKCYRKTTQNRDGWLDIDIAHLSRTDIPDLEAHLSAGKFKVEMRSDGLYVTQIAYTPEAYEAVASQKLKYYSPVINYDGKLRIVELLQIALTNIPAMKNAQPLALSQRGGISLDTTAETPTPAAVTMPASFDSLQALALSGQFTLTRLQLADSGQEMTSLVNALMEALYTRFPYSAHLEEVYPDHAIVGVYEARATGVVHPEHYYYVEYSIIEGAVRLGSVKEVQKMWQDVGVESTELLARRALSEHQTKVAVLEQSIKDMSAQTLTLNQRVQALQSKNAALEQRSFESETALLLSDAKKSGRWTAGMEKLATRTADNARRLGEDPLEAYRDVWAAAPVVIATVQLQQPPDVKNMLPSNLEDTSNKVATLFGMSPELSAKFKQELQNATLGRK